MSDDTQVKVDKIEEKVEEAKTGDILSEVKEPNPYHVVYEENEGLEKLAKWYVVHTYSGHELKVAEQLKVRIASMHVDGKIFQAVVPAQDKIQVKKGQKKTIKEKDIVSTCSVCNSAVNFPKTNRIAARRPGSAAGS